MHPSMHRNERGSFVYYTCDRLPVRHAFTTKFGGVSRGDCESLNLGFNRGDERENVLENYRILAEQLGMDEGRITMTKQIHDTQISVVTEGEAGMGLHQPMAWESDAIGTALPETPLCGFYADCVVTPKTVEVMAEKLGAKRESLIAVLGPSIRQECFETDADVPEAMERLMGERVHPFIAEKGVKFHVNLQGIGVRLLTDAGLSPENVIDSGICTKCCADEFWSHRATHGHRGVQGGIICP